MELVSIIIPAYNAAPYLEETLESVIHSDYRPIEIVLVDDGSRDETLAIAQRWAEKHPECRIFTQTNAGVSAARNHAIREARGRYILPLDADDKISSTFIGNAVKAIEKDEDIKVVGCRARMFGAVDKEWKLPPFSLPLLARKNMIPVTALYRRSDWERVGGYCEENIWREDWDFWLGVFEQGGRYVQLDEEGLYYRVLPQSRRSGAKKHKKEIVDAINRRHPAYMQRYLGGPLHYHRSWSRLLNTLRTERQVGAWEEWYQGEVIHSGRNSLRRHHQCIIKQFTTPPLWRGILYGLFCKSKARRSYEYALRLGDLTPTPIAYKEVRIAGILRQSWYVCRESECTHTFNELIGHREMPHRQDILRAIGRFTARLHKASILHQDYSGGNILFSEDGSRVEMVDLNRVRFCRYISREQGLKNFERLNIDREALRTMAEAYAEALGYDAAYCAEYIISHRWYKHVRQSITHLDD